MWTSFYHRLICWQPSRKRDLRVASRAVDAALRLLSEREKLGARWGEMVISHVLREGRGSEGRGELLTSPLPRLAEQLAMLRCRRGEGGERGSEGGKEGGEGGSAEMGGRGGSGRRGQGERQVWREAEALLCRGVCNAFVPGWACGEEVTRSIGATLMLRHGRG